MKNDIIDPRDESLVDIIVIFFSTEIESLKTLLNNDDFLNQNNICVKKDKIDE